MALRMNVYSEDDVDMHHLMGWSQEFIKVKWRLNYVEVVCSYPNLIVYSYSFQQVCSWSFYPIALAIGHPLLFFYPFKSLSDICI